MIQEYRSIIVQGEDIISITGFADDEKLVIVKPDIVNNSNATFSADQQIEYFKSEGYDISIDEENGHVRIISAIPQNSPINHTRWITTCSKYLAEYLSKR